MTYKLPLLCLALVSACADVPTALRPSVDRPVSNRAASTQTMLRHDPPAPAEIVTVPFHGALTLWPYLTDQFPQHASDPVNAIFAGEAHPLRLRAALRRLDSA